MEYLVDSLYLAHFPDDLEIVLTYLLRALKEQCLTSLLDERHNTSEDQHRDDAAADGVSYLQVVVLYKD